MSHVDDEQQRSWLKFARFKKKPRNERSLRCFSETQLKLQFRRRVSSSSHFWAFKFGEICEIEVSDSRSSGERNGKSLN